MVSGGSTYLYCTDTQTGTLEFSKLKNKKPGIVVHGYNTSTQEAEAEE
jgi:hypothetical protein